MSPKVGFLQPLLRFTCFLLLLLLLVTFFCSFKHDLNSNSAKVVYWWLRVIIKVGGTRQKCQLKVNLRDKIKPAVFVSKLLSNRSRPDGMTTFGVLSKARAFLWLDVKIRKLYKRYNNYRTFLHNDLFSYNTYYGQSSVFKQCQRITPGPVPFFFLT